ncbi:hypothetical protein LOAG_16202, partial [Loa loa]
LFKTISKDEDVLGLTVQFYSLKVSPLRQVNVRGNEILVYFMGKKRKNNLGSIPYPIRKQMISDKKDENKAKKRKTKDHVASYIQLKRNIKNGSNRSRMDGCDL